MIAGDTAHGPCYIKSMTDTDTLPRAARARESEAAGPDALARRTLSYEALRFPGSSPIPMLRDGFESYDGRIEYWDGRAGTAWVVAESSGVHEGSSRRLPHLVERIASVRGAPIVSFGSVSLVVRDAEGRAEQALEADETLYLHPDRAATPERSLTVGEHDFPDVVLEVDHTTDVRPGKLLLYEAWGFPELWVVVPPAGSTRRRPAGVTIHRLDGGRYRTAAESAAFPGWTAAEIHTGLTEPVPTPATSRVLERVGRTLGAREGRGPEDDPLSRTLIEEGRLEGRTQELAAAVQSLLKLRGRSFSPAFPERAASLSGIARDTVMAAALACADEADFWRRVDLEAPPG